MTRSFRTRESIAEELITRSLLKPFLISKGFTQVVDSRKVSGSAIEQHLTAVTPDDRRVHFWVRLCWRRGRKGERAKRYSASQLMARMNAKIGWEASIRQKLARRRADGVTHLLLVQPEDRKIVSAAMIPLDQVLSIWQSQRAESSRLIRTGQTRFKKNHAENGRSPTIWLKDDRAPTITKLLWSAPGVIDLCIGETPSPVHIDLSADDTFDDMPTDESDLGTDAPERLKTERSEVRRDPRVRRAVRARARGRCERESCGQARSFTGFLDVHHILGAAKSDRVFNCVALCPNCHREAHFSPEREGINKQLLKYARQFRRG